MSTGYITEPEIKWVDFWKDLPPSLREEIVPKSKDSNGTTKIQRCLTDGTSFLWCFTGDQKKGTISFERYGLQITIEDIVCAIEAHYGVEMIDEHDDRFYGLECD